MHTRLSIFFPLFILILGGCSIDDVEEAEASLQAVYDNCQNENIDSLDDIEAAIDANGNDLSQSCRDAFANLVLPTISSNKNLSLGSDSPFKEKLAAEKDKIYAFSAISSQNKKIVLGAFFSDGLDFSTMNKEDIQINGVDSQGTESIITDFDIGTPWSDTPAAIAYVQDYSGSMFVSDLQTIGAYMQEFDDIVAAGSERSVTRFETHVYDILPGFHTDDSSIANQLAYDQNQIQGSTALYDAWGNAIEQLNNLEKNIKLLVLATDGGENSSTNYNKSTIKTMVANSNIFHIVIGSFFARKSNLKEILGEKGIILYTYQIDALKNNIDEVKNILKNSITLNINQDISAFESTKIVINDVTTTLPVN